ncbi:carboxypeptidase C prc1 [Dermatophagoides pteronyssinus]|uniref:Carboxypeptidase C prc1 n=1 Tax=Dermatophagoides pteronyssinus TaxID=6956 RepID=A0ABQ8J1I7_DERPT|nr:carboxypeptidase C prc1 [Dermatophagoides pteronyssinus]
MTNVDWIEFEQDDASMNLSFPSAFADYLTEELVQNLKNKFNEIGEIWRFVGFPDSYREQQTEEIRRQFIDLADRLLATNSKFRDDGLKYREYKLKEVNKILSDLSLPSFQLSEEFQTLIMQNKMLQKKFNELVVVKNERMSKLESLENKLQKVNQLLGEIYQPTKFVTDIPSEMELKSLALILRDREKLLTDRKMKFESLKPALMKFTNDLEYKPENDDEKMLIVLNRDIIYSQFHINKLMSFLNKLSSLRETAKTQIEKQLEKLQQLYNRLDIDQKERDLFLMDLVGTLPRQQQLLDAEIAKYEIIKKNSIEKIIKNVRIELQALFEKCRVSQFDGYLMDSNEYTEELLNELEAEFNVLKIFHDKYQEVFEKLIEFEDSMECLIELERKSTDPNRFNNRGGALLQMERDRKICLKKLPKLEKEIRTLITMIETEHNIPLNSYGLDIDKYFEMNWEQLKDCKTIPTTSKNSKSQNTTESAKKINQNALSNKKGNRIPFSPRSVNQRVNKRELDEQPRSGKIAKRNIYDDIVKVDEGEKQFQMGIQINSTMIDAENNLPHMNLHTPLSKATVTTRIRENRRRSKSVDFVRNRPRNRIPIIMNSNSSSGYSSSSNITNVRTVQRPTPFLP